MVRSRNALVRGNFPFYNIYRKGYLSVLRVNFCVVLMFLASACSRPDVNIVIFGDNQTRATREAPILTPSRSLEHFVRDGDTVYAISRRYGVSIRDIIIANKLNPPYLLQVGQQILLPISRRHTVIPGDTILNIALHYRVAMSELVRVNSLREPYTIVVGDQLKIPGGQLLGLKSREDKARVKPRKISDSSNISLTKKTIEVPMINPPARESARFAWPLGGEIISGFGSKGKGRHNDGINIVAPRGAPVKAAENGVVAYSGNELRGFGNLLLIKHADGFMSAYAHNEKLLVIRGDIVKKGQIVAHVGSSGNVTTPQLHFELRKGKRAVDPRQYLPVQMSRNSNFSRMFGLTFQPDPVQTARQLYLT